MAAPPSGTVTLLFTDIERSTRLLARTGGDVYAELLGQHRRLLGEAFDRHNGFDAGSEGDASFAVFASAVDAAAAAGDVQRALAEHLWPDGNEIRVRIGLHTGEPRLTESGYVGLDVHEAARVMAAGHGGQVLLTASTRALLDERFQVRDLGVHRLRDLPGPLRLYQLLADGLRVDFPPLRTPDNRPTNLPAPTTTFIGRAAELAEVGQLLARDEVRLLTLTGPGGSGKTRLALQVAASAVDKFDNGVFVVQLAPVRDWELVVPTIAQTLGLREQSHEAVIDALADYLRERRLLLVLDNLEQVIAVAPVLAGLLAHAPDLKMIATSRAPLRLSGEHVYAVRPLALQESVQLFADRAQAAVPGFAVTDENEDTVAEICRRLEGLPLAIELAAPRVRTLSPPALFRRLEERLTLLTGGPQDFDERQRTLRGAIEWSYDLLLAKEQTLFTRLGTFVGGCRLNAAQAVCDPDRTLYEALLDGLDSLAEKSLLHLRTDSDGEPRFWMLESIREFALEKLESATELDAARRRHMSWFAELAECLDAEWRAGAQPASIARLEDDYPNVRAALDRAREDPDGELLLRLATTLWPFWATRGYVAEGLRTLEDALRLAGRRPARALVGLNSLRLLGGSGEGLLDDVQEALRVAQEVGDPLTLAQAWNLLGRVEGTLMGSMAQADMAWLQALAYAESADLRAERSESIGWLMMSANFGPLPVEDGIARCKKFYDEAADDPVIQANSCVEQAALEAMRGEFSVARELLAKGRGSFAELGFSLLMAMTAQEAHYVELLAGDPAAATKVLRESYDELEQMGERAYLSSAAALLAHTLHAEGKLDEAEAFSRVAEDATAPADVFSQVLWRAARAKIHARRGELAKGEALARQAVALVEKTDLLNTQGDTLVTLGEILSLSDRPAEAATAFAQAASYFERKGNTVSLGRVRALASELAPSR